MPEYLDSHKFYANLTAGWTDISAYVINDVTPKWGMGGNDPISDRIADTGTMELVLNNAGGQFTPGGASLLAGWEEGVEIYLVLTYENTPFKRFRGRVQSIRWNPAEWGGIVRVTVADWMRVALEFPLVAPAIQTDQTADQVITTIKNLMAIQPAATDLDTGVITFPYAFDTVGRKAWAYQEFHKANQSEFGYIYLIKDATNGETLVFENQSARRGWRALDTITYPTADDAALLKNDGGYLRLMGGGKILLNHQTTTNAEFDGVMLSNGRAEAQSQEIINYLTLTAYPSVTAGSLQVLFTLGEPIPIASGQTITIRGSYANPNGGSPVNGANMQNPVATTDYLGNTVRGGGGTNITADLVVTPDYGAESFAHTVYNGNAASGWVNSFQCRGYGITRDNPITEIVQDSASINKRGERTAYLDQKYNKNLTEGTWIAKSIVEQHKDPHNDIRELTYCPSDSRVMMYLFLNVDVGYLIRAVSTIANVDKWFYVQSVRFTLTRGGAIESATYGIKPAPSLQS